MEIILKGQEECTNAKFNGQLVATQGFISEFGDEAFHIVINTLEKIIAERVNSVEGADYLQVCEYEGVKFWVISDENSSNPSDNVVSFLLPSEY